MVGWIETGLAGASGLNVILTHAEVLAVVELSVEKILLKWIVLQLMPQDILLRIW